MKRASAAAIAAACLLICLLVAACGGSSPARHGGRTHSAAFVKSAEHAGLPAPAGIGLTPNIPGFDAVTVRNLPLDARAVLCYANGPFANCTAVRAREPHAHLIPVDVSANGPTARILDTEPLDAVPSQDAGFVRRMIALHVYRPGVYADEAEMPAVEHDLAAAGLKRWQYVLIVAAWNGNPAIPAGFDAHQWKSTATLDFDSFSVRFFTPPPRPLPVCVHHRMRRATCAADKAKVARWDSAATASRRALTRVDAGLAEHGCRRPYRRPVCRELGHDHQVLEQRVRWFTSHAKALEATL